MLKKSYHIIFILLFCLSSAYGQESKLDYVDKELLVELVQPMSTTALVESLSNQNVLAVKWQIPEKISPAFSIWKLNYEGEVSESVVLDWLRHQSYIQTAQLNHYVKLREQPNATTPNDPNFNNQWHHINTGIGGGIAGVDMDSDLAWDITTGGETILGDTIVIAIIDNGIDLNHTDIIANRWVNQAEIPNNNIDDDNNGYVDDYLGWAPITNNDAISGGNGHGTAVAGIAGAEGDNNTGVVGVNWNVKLMIIRNNFIATESIVLQSYGYALQQRKIYNQTNGQQGAYVVATNASWGINYGKPADAPLWCSFYDTLGKYGILNIGATTNTNTDVDVQGDLPTTCPSDYLVAVTNLDKQGRKVMNAGYGQTSIDLGAFGEGVYTARTANSYGTFGGTSAAAPQVAGAVGLLYAGACTNFMNYSRVHPDSAALRIKDYILNGTVPVIDLDGTTVSEGYLNLNNSLNNAANNCPATSCFAPFQLSMTGVIDTQAIINWNSNNNTDSVEITYRPSGGNWIDTFQVIATNQQQLLTDLQPCSEYEVLLRAICGGVRGEVNQLNFRTDGCCEPPQRLWLNQVSEDSAQIEWPAVLAADYYIIEYQEDGLPTWNQILTTNSQPWLIGLQSCTQYNLIVKTVCLNGDTTGSTIDTLSFITLGCQSCANVSYCVHQGTVSKDDFITRVAIDNYVNTSGDDGGYRFFSNTPILLNQGDYHTISISQGKRFVEHATVWLDINQDGDFEDADEELFTTVFSTLDTFKNGSFIVPASSLIGVSRLRVALRWNQPPPLCGTYRYGEVEDYCVQIIPGTAVQKVASEINDLIVYPNPFSEQIQVEFTVQKITPISFRLFNNIGQQVYQKDITTVSVGPQKTTFLPDIPAGVYTLVLQTTTGQQHKQIVKY